MEEKKENILLINNLKKTKTLAVLGTDAMEMCIVITDHQQTIRISTFVRQK
jgi:hypothetical protein